MGGEKARNKFSANTLLVRAKNVQQKFVGKKCEKRFFYIHTNIVTKKWDGKNAPKTIFPETYE